MNIKVRYLIQILIIIIILFVLDFICHKNEYYEDKKIVLKNWWSNDDKKSIDIFSKLFSDKFDNYDKIEIYSIFGNETIRKNNNTLYIQFSGESNYKDPTLFNVNFIPATEYVNNNIILPYAYYHVIHMNIDINYFLQKRQLGINKNNFCLFSVSNGGCNERNNFFHKLSNYKKVDSCGKAMNNLGYNCPGGQGDIEYGHFISNYKFMICFENKSQPNYFTEKLINAYYYGTIPIYWGCSTINKYVNMDSILYLKDDFTEDDVDRLIDEIKILDNNDELYRNKYESVFFKDGLLPDEFNFDKIKEKINSMC